jgi:hypothetical protein
MQFGRALPRLAESLSSTPIHGLGLPSPAKIDIADAVSTALVLRAADIR